MKRIWGALLLLIGIVGFCWWSTARVDQICENAANLLYQAETCCALGDFQGAEEYADASRRLWEQHEGFLGMALRHTESDDIYTLFPPLLQSCQSHDAEDFTQRNQELRAVLRVLSRMEKPYYFNVL